MLGKMPEDDAKKYLEQMKLDNAGLLHEVKKYFLLFDDIIAMPDGIAATFWGDPEIDLEIMATALADSETETVEKLQGYLPGKKQAMFTSKTAEDNVAKREIDEAKAKIKDQLQKKIESGDINIEDVFAVPEVAEEA
jgi:flagellar motor switch protein FliG